MEITRQSESFNLKETTEAFEMTGSASNEVSGSINMHFNVTRIAGEHVGNCNYNKYSEGSNVNFSVNCSEENRAELTAYANTVIAKVIDHFKTV